MTKTATTSPDVLPVADRPDHSLAHLPVTLFASVMGLGGLSLAWRRAAKVWDLPQWPALTFLAMATLAFVVVGTLYALKWARHPAAARAELRHPVRMTFATTITISVLVLATAGQDVAPALASVLWWIGAIGHLAATIALITVWFSRRDIGHGSVTPAWFIPVVGNVITPLAAEQLGSIDLAWFAFGVGVVFWLGLLPLLLQRVLLHDPPLPPKMLPTIAIFIAPPAVMMLSWQALTGAVDGPVVRVLYSATMVFVLLLLAQVPRLRRLPFALPAWAYTFPLAAAAAAATTMAASRPQPAYDVVALLLLGGQHGAGAGGRRAHRGGRRPPRDLRAGVSAVTSQSWPPDWQRVLVVVAHPDDESFALGALLDRLVQDGADVSMLCLTRGEASTLGADAADLAAVRADELAAAGAVIGITSTTALGHPDGGLAGLDPAVLAADVDRHLDQTRPDGMLVFDPVCGVTGHPDHEAASVVAIAAARQRGLPVLGWALPQAVADALNVEYGATFVGHPQGDLIEVAVDRRRQRMAIACHASQAVPGSVLWRRLELLGDREYLRVPTAPTPTTGAPS